MRQSDTAMLTFGARARRVPRDEVKALVRQARKKAEAAPSYALTAMCDDLDTDEADRVIGASLAEALRLGTLARGTIPDPAAVWVMGTYTPSRHEHLPARIYYRASVMGRLLDPRTPAIQTHDVFVLCALITRLAARLDSEGRIPGLPCRLAGCANGRLVALPHSRSGGIEDDDTPTGAGPGAGSGPGIAAAAVAFFGDLAPRTQAMVEHILERGAHIAYLRRVAASSPDSRYHVSLPPAPGQRRPALVS